MNFGGKRVTVMGLGHFGGGVAAARWLARNGALVTVTDTADETALADSLAALWGEPITSLHLGGHREEDFRAADLIVVNPAVHPDNPLLHVARQAGARLTTEIGLFMDACPAPIIGVTGSNGKSTTAAMTAAILSAAGHRVWLGGNIGGSLLGDLDQFSNDHWVVLEVSSFQLALLPPEDRPPHIAVVTNCSPNHLDWHGTYADYVTAKQRILTGQSERDLAVLNTFDHEVAGWAGLVRGRRLPLPDLAGLPPLRLPGRHNRINAACAAAAARGAGCDGAAIRRGLASFAPLPQRLEQIAVIGGRHFYNDSTATTPESTVAALESLAEPVWLLAGGRDKGCDCGPLCAAIAQFARGAALFGSVRDRLHERVAALAPHLPCIAVDSLADALAWSFAQSRPGDVILLSPGMASTDQFRSFRHRGECFAQLVRELETSHLRAAPSCEGPLDKNC